MITITSNNRHLDMEDIERMERVVGRSLPEPYRDFLLAHNGGRPKPDIIDIAGAPFRGTDIQVFHSVDDEFQTCDILWGWENLDGCKENLLLPIANDSGGHTFALVLDEENYGHVYYFDSNEDPPHPYHIANNFNEFLNKIRAQTPEELAEIDEMIIPQ